MSDLNSPEDALAKLRTLVREGNFEFAPRKKSHVTSKLARIIVDTLSIDHYNSMGFDYDGTGDLVFAFISDDGIRYYIKFKFMNSNTTVKFISFHEAEF